MIASSLAVKEIMFEPGVAGGGSFWTGDNLLATLTVHRAAKRPGRLSLRDTDRAFDLLHTLNGSRHTYQLMEGIHSMGRAEWVQGEGWARMTYRGGEYRLNLTGLWAAAAEGQPLVALAPSPGWNDRLWVLRVADGADLPLASFYLYIAYDFRH